MRPAVYLILAIVFGVTSATPRDGKHLILVPEPQIVYVPAIPSDPMTHKVPAHANRVPCGSPAYTCQGPCVSNGVGGIPAVKGEFPWLAQLYSGGRYICSGSIIDNYYVLTAASCVEPATPSSVAGLRLRVGDFKLNTNEDGAYVERNVTTVYRHTDYKPQNSRNPALHDIAVLKLTDPITFTDYIRPICIDDGNPRVDTGYVEGLLSGYGKISYSNRPQTNMLHKVSVRIGSPQECQSAYTPSSVQLRDTNICAGTPTVPSVDPCVGDNGGPLIVKTGANSYKQVGLLSYGMSCAGPQAVYTRVASYRGWIDQVKMQKV